MPAICVNPGSVANATNVLTKIQLPVNSIIQRIIYDYYNSANSTVSKLFVGHHTTDPNPSIMIDYWRQTIHTAIAYYVVLPTPSIKIKIDDGKITWLLWQNSGQALTTFNMTIWYEVE